MFGATSKEIDDAIKWILSYKGLSPKRLINTGFRMDGADCVVVFEKRVDRINKWYKEERVIIKNNEIKEVLEYFKNQESIQEELFDELTKST